MNKSLFLFAAAGLLLFGCTKPSADSGNGLVFTRLILSGEPVLNESFNVTFVLVSDKNVDEYATFLVLPEGLVVINGETQWSGSLVSGEEKTFSVTLKPVNAGAFSLGLDKGDAIVFNVRADSIDSIDLTEVQNNTLIINDTNASAVSNNTINISEAENVTVINFTPADDGGYTAEGVAKVVEANNDFALKLYSILKEDETVKQDNGNIFISPYSIATAFAIAYEGARGETAEELQNAFNFPEDEKTRRSSFARLYNNLNQPSSSYALYTANALWAQKDYPFLSEYLMVGEKYYGGKITNLDFIEETEKSRKTINEWVESRTNDKITDLIPEGNIDELTRLVITNTIYFKANWTLQFGDDYTKDAAFITGTQTHVSVKMMHLPMTYMNYGEDTDSQILELSYNSTNLSMIIILPKTNDLKKLEETLSIEKLVYWKSLLKTERVDVFIPKFSLNPDYSLAEPLEKLGVSLAFMKFKADLSGMDGSRYLYIQKALHKTFLSVNEQGTEAGAATAVIVGFASGGDGIPFHADHPFLFFIQDKETGNVLFLGRLNNPGENK